MRGRENWLRSEKNEEEEEERKGKDRMEVMFGVV